MRRVSFIRLIFLVALFAGVVWPLAESYGPFAGERDSHEPAHVLLLKNGQVLEGTITFEGERLLVTIPYGEVRLAIKDIEHICESLEAGYRWKRDAIAPGDLKAHVALARWCHSNGLPRQTQEQLAQVEKISPRHPWIALLRRQLQARQQPHKRGVAPRKREAAVSSEDLANLVRGMPDGTVETFTHTIQPTLINHCATAGCHGSGSSNSYKLVRLSRGHKPTRRITQRNLHATMQWIDREEPAASRLLAAAIEPHGESTSPVFKSENVVAYRSLTSWVLKLDTHSPKPKHVKKKEVTLSQTLPLNGADRQQVLPTRTRKTSVYRPRDAFDPEVFNRRYHPEASK